MSTEDINKVVVTLHKGVDVDAFIDEMSSVGNNSPYVPSRSVEIYNLKEDSLRNVDFVMSRSEMEELKKDPRVLDARYGTKAENGITPIPYVVDSTRSYYRTNTFAAGNVDHGWGLLNTQFTTNQYTTGNLVNYQQLYTSTGFGVDFVIQDTGLQIDHPEFQNSVGVSRVNTINWYLATGVSGTMPPNFYTDVNGHGTNVCGIAAGKTYGSAKDAAIYVMNILGDNANSRIPISQSFNLLRIWHTQKPSNNSPYWTTKRPTVVNMSWGYNININAAIGGIYRGTPWSGTGAQPAYGLINNGSGVVPVVVSSVEADIEDCLDAGVILTAAAGNSSYKIDVPGGIDYNNLVNYSGGFSSYYMRGSTPNVNTRVFKVGAVGLQLSPERKASFSCTGPGVGIYVAGDYVVGPVSNTTNLGGYPIRTYPYNSSFKVGKVSGTSQASPGVAGLICCLLQARPWYDVGRIMNWIYGYAISNRLSDTAGGYTDFQSLQGGPNRYLYNPWGTGSQPTMIMPDSDVEIYARKL
jgi:hypothetical protein